MSSTTLVEPEWLRMISDRQPIVAELLAKSTEEQQQARLLPHPSRNLPTAVLPGCGRAPFCKGQLPSCKRSFADIRSLTLTGSGSSEYAGDCVRMPLQNELGVVAQAIAGGALLLHGSKALAATASRIDGVACSFRGQSRKRWRVAPDAARPNPRSATWCLTCNEAGSLARTYREPSPSCW